MIEAGILVGCKAASWGRDNSGPWLGVWGQGLLPPSRLVDWLVDMLSSDKILIGGTVAGVTTSVAFQD